MVELEKDDGGPAFPTGDDPNSKLYANYGISARDYFAAKAMQAMWTNPEFMEAVSHRFDSNMDMVRAGIATSAYTQADAMLAERAK